MRSKRILPWLTGFSLVIAAAVIYLSTVMYDYGSVNTDGMLNISVSIKSIGNVRTDSVGDSVWGSQVGSGFLVSKARCEVWTNHHVVKDAALVEVFPRGWALSNGIPAIVLNASPRYDIAILKLDHCDSILGEAHLADSSQLKQGDEAYAVGNPLGLNPDSISRGIVSHTERYVEDPFSYIQTDATIGPGSSGGALFNRRGEVVGINSGIANSANGILMGVSYSIPINMAQRIAKQLRAGNPKWGFAGFESNLAELTQEQAKIFGVPDNLSAVSLTRKPESGPAAEVMSARDVIYRVNGQSTQGVGHLKAKIGALLPGERLVLDVTRDGEQKTIELVLENGWHPQSLSMAEQYSGYLGMTLEMWGEDAAVNQSFDTPIITRVQGLGPAHRSRISSSQHNFIRFGGMAMRRVFDVRTISGVVFEGQYHSVASVEAVNKLAKSAFDKSSALLLEIQYWKRSYPQQINSELKYTATAYYRLQPSLYQGFSEAMEVGQRSPDTELMRLAMVNMNVGF
ncbi:MAG: trypsin-like serine protease [Gammaproteobacteria bacterium]|nr:trypsin-like serine protease [Gammaproteobacteria bacterium]